MLSRKVELVEMMTHPRPVLSNSQVLSKNVFRSHLTMHFHHRPGVIGRTVLLGAKVVGAKFVEVIFVAVMLSALFVLAQILQRMQGWKLYLEPIAHLDETEQVVHLE